MSLQIRMVLVYPALVRRQRLRDAWFDGGNFEFLAKDDEGLDPSAFDIVIAHNGYHHFCPCGELNEEVNNEFLKSRNLFLFTL